MWYLRNIATCRPPDVAPVVSRFNYYEALSPPAYKFNNSAQGSFGNGEHLSVFLAKLDCNNSATSHSAQAHRISAESGKAWTSY